uniref:ZNF380 coiled-coil domain-containing protein n=1 Tax=Strigamia maritima TaxID=126957 RepID=T1ISR6_STRMM
MKLKNDKATNNSSSNPTTHSTILKRSRPGLDNELPVKKTKVDSKTEANSTPKQRQLRVSFSMSDGEEEENDETTETKSELPADFFDVEMKSSPATTTTTVPSAVKSNGKKEIPEGFFDDPVADAKVRKVEYRDPMDEEWDKFQKVISEASSVSQNMMDENDEDMKTEREIDEIDEQIHNWARVEALQRRKDETRKDNEVTATDAEMEEMPLDDDEVEDLLNWRSKDAWR